MQLADPHVAARHEPAPLRVGDPAVLARTEGGRCLVDLRCVPVEDEDLLVEAILAAGR